MPAPQSRRILSAIGLVVAVLGMSACRAESPFGEDQAPVTTLVASPVYNEGNDDAQARLATLQRVIDQLRSATASGWTGRQDDLTGYLADLSGGRYAAAGAAGVDAVVAEFFSSYGLDLFGVGPGDLAVAETLGAEEGGPTAVRATQELDGVPVLDGQLVITLDSADDPAITAIRGRVFPGLDTTTEPRVKARAAARAASRLSGGDSAGRPRLLVMPENGGVLVWEVTVLGAQSDGSSAFSDGLYYLSAENGDLVTVRPMSVERMAGLLPGKVGKATALFLAAADENHVEVTGPNPIGGQLTAAGVRTPDGVALVDTTVPTYDDVTGDGAIVTFTADDTENIPGRLYVERQQNGTTISDPEAIAAHALSRVVYDYYAGLGRASWDGAGGTLLSTVNVGDDTFCNSKFVGNQMIYGNPCADENGPAELTEVEIDTAGHEITHGVINTSSNLVYSGQSGALNESFADYFGNVIGNAYKDSDSAAVFEGSCTGITQQTAMCNPNPEGGFSLRYMLNGATYDDYLRILNPTFRTRVSTGYDADHGGVHLNSAVWNNALWSIRARLAQIDGTDGNDSPLAADFDKIVYAALTTQLTSGSGFFDARAAIEDTATDAGADPVILDVTRQVFDLNKICAGCSDVGTVNGTAFSTAPQTEIEPAVSGDRVAWVDLSLGNPGIGLPAVATLDGAPAPLTGTPETTQVVFAGDSTITLDIPNLGNNGRIVRYDASGASTVLADTGFATVVSGLAGSDEGAAWAANDDGTVSFVEPAGEVVTADLPGLGGDTVTTLGTGQGVVALGTDGGRVIVWEPRGGFTELGRVAGAVTSVATYGGRVVAVDDSGTATLLDTTGRVLPLSDTAGYRFGAAINGDYAVWSEVTGELSGAIATELGGVTDTDLYLYSFATGTIYNLLAQTGQQGYPAISGDRIVWQDTVFGNNDIFTSTLPPGL